MSKSETKQKDPKKEIGIVCPHCEKFIPDPPKTTLNMKISWYLDSTKEIKSTTKTLKIAKYVQPPTIGENLRFGNDTYQVISIKESGTNEAVGKVKLIHKGEPIDYPPTSIQDNEEIIDKVKP